jgi:FkbM family methyltransferase
MQMRTSSMRTIPHRLPLLAKLRTSALKRRIRVAQWLAHTGRRSKAPITCRYFGADFIVVPGDAIADEIAIKRYERWELKMMLKACGLYRPEVFIDVGANIGLYTCALGRRRAAARLLAFEPDEANFARLSENIARNRLSGVTSARSVAVGATKGTALLVPGTPGNCGLSKLGGDGSVSVDVITLDDELDIRNGTICIKIDVEGHELDVLAGAPNLFRSNAGYAQIECHQDRANATDITKTMEDYGWQFIDSHHLNLLFERPLSP